MAGASPSVKSVSPAAARTSRAIAASALTSAADARANTGTSSISRIFSTGCRRLRRRARPRRVATDASHDAAPGRAVLALDGHAEEALHQVGVLGEQAEHLLVAQRQADCAVHGRDRGGRWRPFHDLVEGQRRRRLQLDRATPCPSSSTRALHGCRRAGTAGRRAWRPAVEHAPVLVPHLPAGVGDAEQLVDRHVVEQRHAPQPVGELHGRQRLHPARCAARRPPSAGPPAPTTPPRTRTSPSRRGARARTPDRRRAPTRPGTRRNESRWRRRSDPRRAPAARGCPRRRARATSGAGCRAAPSPRAAHRPAPGSPACASGPSAGCPGTRGRRRARGRVACSSVHRAAATSFHG